jgi:hypothetical protein
VARWKPPPSSACRRHGRGAGTESSLPIRPSSRITRSGRCSNRASIPN